MKWAKLYLYVKNLRFNINNLIKKGVFNLLTICIRNSLHVCHYVFKVKKLLKTI